ncbi:thioesterase superfamily protein [Pseudopedobacter saltans DSM 12145]|uniref:Thioesterase superfamily protein n=1 Tax=Pseudopedobacter saltans (strain ATCC 51119 / DSM 12145 / JCM 21818 / CCUG 39354 / LMG 10337 / NBRC 100064 / NCIMB 13643) TaxID=762903 RepID=F0SEB9_PSESL|nr:PaaI family thioesterase [Pseudopedobacter saltans]ADY54041.1 thioesterase superfamily protein [Pseudopedobacter saltans DSM 12145]
MNTDRKRAYEWENPLETVEIAKEISGLELLNRILNGELPAPPIAKTLDFHPSKVEEGKVLFEFTPYEFHYNPIGSVHGGVISTVLDTAMGCAVHSVLPRNVVYTTLELKVNFIKSVNLKSGKMYAEGRLIHLGRTTALVEADLRNENGTLYAHAVSTCMILNNK